MMTFFEFLSLLGEYCLLPVILFAVIYVAEKREKEKQRSTPLNKIRGSGHEFILIEGFAVFSIFLRILSGKQIHFFSANGFINQNEFIYLLVSLFMTIYMAIIFFTCLLKRRQTKYATADVFRKEYYNFFACWWLSIGLIAFLSEFALYHAQLCLLLIPLFIISFLEFRKILFKYFLTYRILYKEFTNLVAQENYDLAQTKGHNLLKKLYRIKGNKHYGQIMGIVLDMGATYYLFKDKSCTKAKEGIKFFSEFMNKQAFPRSSENPSEKEWFFITYAGLYVRNNEPEIAKRLIIDNVEDDPQFYLDKINENKYDEIIKAK